jgi:hypothetical protein
MPMPKAAPKRQEYVTLLYVSVAVPGADPYSPAHSGPVAAFSTVTVALAVPNDCP